MKILQKILVSVVMLMSLSFNSLANEFSQSGQTGIGILPDTEMPFDQCYYMMLYVSNKPVEARTFISERGVKTLEVATISFPHVEYTDILACGIITGEIKFWMVPFYIRYALEFIISLAGLLAVGFVVYGGFLYLFSGISENKDAGKVAIKNGILGMVVTIVAWGVVSIVVQLLTSF